MTMVSVVVATYRRIEELKRALSSLASQTYKNMEIVLVDDNGNEEWNQKVASIIQDFLSLNPCISIKYIINMPNQGSAKTRNIGIQASRGEYVTFLDDDDLYLPNKVESQVAFMKNGDLDYCITDLELFDDKERLVDRRTREYIKDTSCSSLLRYHLMYHMTGTDTMMFKKSYLEEIGCFAPIDVGDEYYLMQRAIEGKGKFGYLSRCDIKAYVHTGDGGLSSGDGKINGENALFEYKKQFFDQVDAKARRYIRMRHYAVLAFAELRRKKYSFFIINACKSVFYSPAQCAKMLLERKI